MSNDSDNEKMAPNVAPVITDILLPDRDIFRYLFPFITKGEDDPPPKISS